MIPLLAALAISSISPQEALKRSHAASKREAKEICERIEKELSEKFDGDSFSTTFDAKLKFTAYYVRVHFEDHWRIEWNNWDTKRDPYFWQMDQREPMSVVVEETFGWASRRVPALRWKMELRPKPGAKERKLPNTDASGWRGGTDPDPNNWYEIDRKDDDTIIPAGD